nr:unnamed protein product [Callosobruchus chinensis]
MLTSMLRGSAAAFWKIQIYVTMVR